MRLLVSADAICAPPLPNIDTRGPAIIDSAEDAQVDYAK